MSKPSRRTGRRDRTGRGTANARSPKCTHLPRCNPMPCKIPPILHPKDWTDDLVQADPLADFETMFGNLRRANPTDTTATVRLPLIVTDELERRYPGTWRDELVAIARRHDFVRLSIEFQKAATS